MTPETIIAAARSAVGTPFRHQGRVAGEGLDCAGLLVYVAGLVGAACIDRAGYARMPTGGQLEAALQENVDAGLLRRVSLINLAPADMVLMRFESERASRHLGIVAGDTLIHAWATARQVCEHRIDAAWRARFVAAYRFAGVVHGE